MFHKVHFRLTLLCAGITVFITVLLSLTCLHISEKNLEQTWFSSFQHDMNTLLSGFETQTVLSHKWLSQAEGNGTYIISLKDNDAELFWGSRSAAKNDRRAKLIAAGWDYYDSHYRIAPDDSRLGMFHQEFSFSSAGRGKPDYLGCAAFSVRPAGTLSILILKSLAPLHAQIQAQRIKFAVMILFACVLLAIFSRYFTGKLLIPIEKSRDSQLAFVAAASHELRTPLSVILSAASACQKASSAEQEKFFHIIREEGECMSRLISDLLMLAGADSHGFDLHPAPCEPDTLLLNVYESFEAPAREKGYQLKIFLPDMQTAPLICDAERIHQLLSILIQNAFSHTPKGSCITLSLVQNQENTIFSVADNGPGIPDAAKAHIFERFYRLDKSRKSDGHFGLGLSIAAEIAAAHRGTLSVSDAPGGGSVFTLTLPS